MYAYIKGELTEIYPDYIVIEAGGVGYVIFVPGRVIAKLPDLGAELKIYTHFYLREDAMMLYGFLERDELAVFRLLLGVGGVGPKAALSVLSVLSADDLRFAVLSGDSKTIAKAPGVGSKIAQRIVLELKDRFSLEETLEKKMEPAGSKAGASEDKKSIKNDAILALTSLGYTSTESMKAVSNVEITGDMTVEEVLKKALKQMAF